MVGHSDRLEGGSLLNFSPHIFFHHYGVGVGEEMGVCDSFGGTQAGVRIPSVTRRGFEIFGGGELTNSLAIIFLKEEHTH